MLPWSMRSCTLAVVMFRATPRAGKHCLRRPGVDTLTATQCNICLTTLQDATFQTGSTHTDVSWAACSPSSARDGMTPLPRLQIQGTNYICFSLVSCLAYSSTLMMEAACSSETSVDFQWTTQCYIPEDRAHNNRCWNNLKSNRMKNCLPVSSFV
jgi:hypothetical protein